MVAKPNGTSGNDILETDPENRRVLGYGGDDYISAADHGGGIYGGNGNDTLIGGGRDALQTHMYGGRGDDHLYMGTSDVDAPYGDHAFGGEGYDRFYFTVGEGDYNTRITGRIDDFDPSRDEIWIDDERIDLNDLPDNVRIVGLHNQPWILIDDRILYALEGARQYFEIDDVIREGENHDHYAHDHDNAPLIDIGNDEQEERHFIDWPEAWKDGVPASADITFADFVSYFPADELRYIPENLVETSSKPDDLKGSEKGDYIPAGNGADTVYGDKGNDLIDGGEFSDLIYGGDGNDSISGGLDNDLLYGDAGQDIIYGGSGEDTLYGGGGDDKLSGNAGNDLIYGDKGQDRLYGGRGNDSLYGGEGDDVLNGALGPDDLTLEKGGNNLLDGGSGNDTLYAAPNGNSTMIGGEGTDTFVMAENAMITLSDFCDESDVFDFNGLSPGSDVLGDHLSQRIGPDGTDMVLTLGQNSMVVFEGYREEDRESLLSALRQHPSVDEVQPDEPLLGGTNQGDAGNPQPVPEDQTDFGRDPAPADGSCFVATACYGNKMHPDVSWLRLYRNRILRKHLAGRAFIVCYNALGPKAARFVAADKVTGRVMRKLLGALVKAGRRHWPDLRW